MNRELVGIMAKYDITQKMMANKLNISVPTFKKKLDHRLFTQKEIDSMTSFLTMFDKNISYIIFFGE